MVPSCGITLITIMVRKFASPASSNKEANCYRLSSAFIVITILFFKAEYQEQQCDTFPLTFFWAKCHEFQRHSDKTKRKNNFPKSVLLCRNKIIRSPDFQSQALKEWLGTV
jgi:hypothetical protein